MAYPTRLLNNGEVVHIDAHPHWSTLTTPALSAVGLVVFAVVAAANGLLHHSASRFALLALFVGVLVFILLRVSRYLTTEFVVTSTRIIDRHGLLSKTSSEIPLERITNTKLTRNLLERIVGDGDLVVESAGRDGQATFTDVADPEGVQRLILGLLDTRDNRSSTAPSTPVNIAEQIERLAALHAAGSLSAAEFAAAKATLVNDAH